MDKKSSPAFTMSSRLKQTINRFSPGPMSYRQNLDIIKHTNPNATIGKAQRILFKASDGPAPGQYNIQRPLRPKSSCAVFPTYEEPEIKEQKRKLGPGSYEPNYEKVLRKSLSSCKFSKSQRKSDFKDPENFQSPGPLAYDPKIDKVVSHEPMIKFGSSLRVDESKVKASIPGPGKYETESMKAYKSESAFKFPQQKREKSLKQQTPGPLAYTIESQFDKNIKNKKGFKIAFSKGQHSSMINIPGPTSYNSEKKLSLKRAPAFSISHSERKNPLLLKSDAPGPQNYNPDSPPKKRAGSALITSSRRELEKQIEKKIALPGPGQYQKAFEYKTIGNGIKFTIPRTKLEKQKERITQKRPGPWSYNPIEALKQSVKYGTLGKSERQSFAKKGIPGPADYDIKDEKNKTIKGPIIGSQKRSKQKKAFVPGPNAYVIPSTLGITKYYEKSDKTQTLSKTRKQ